MHIIREDDIINKSVKYTLEIGYRDFENLELTTFDRALIKDIEESEGTSDKPVADILLGLETIARRIEEKTNEKAL